MHTWLIMLLSWSISPTLSKVVRVHGQQQTHFYTLEGVSWSFIGAQYAKASPCSPPSRSPFCSDCNRESDFRDQPEPARRSLISTFAQYPNVDLRSWRHMTNNALMVLLYSKPQNSLWPKEAARLAIAWIHGRGLRYHPRKHNAISWSRRWFYPLRWVQYHLLTG